MHFVIFLLKSRAGHFAPLFAPQAFVSLPRCDTGRGGANVQFGEWVSLRYSTWIGTNKRRFYAAFVVTAFIFLIRNHPVTRQYLSPHQGSVVADTYAVLRYNFQIVYTSKLSWVNNEQRLCSSVSDPSLETSSRASH